jgi:hypothetical protein
VASIGDGWLTLPNRRDLAISRRTGFLEGVEDLKRYLQVLWQLCDERGRTSRPDIGYVIRPGTASGPAELIDLIGELESIGVTWLIWPGPGSTRPAALDAIEAFGAEVIVASTSSIT